MQRVKESAEKAKMELSSALQVGVDLCMLTVLNWLLADFLRDLGLAISFSDSNICLVVGHLLLFNSFAS